MKIYLKDAILILLMASWTAVLVGDANATINMTEREHVQTIVWIMEAVTAVTIMTIFWFVWRISKRAQQKRKSQQETSSD